MTTTQRAWVGIFAAALTVSCGTVPGEPGGGEADFGMDLAVDPSPEVGADSATDILGDVIADVPADERTIVAIEAGYEHVCTIDSVGAVACWGGGSPTMRGLPDDAAPTRTASIVEGIPPSTELSLGVITSCALHPNASVSCWGAVAIDFNNGADEVPRGIDAFNEVRDVGVLGAWAFPCALEADGGIRCVGEMGRVDEVPAPAAVQLATSNWFGCGLHADGSATCFEADGRGSNIHMDLTDGVAIANGWPSCSVHEDGRVTCVDSVTEGSVDQLSRREIDGLLDPIAVEGSTHGFACAITSERRVVCWGANHFGQLGVPSMGETDSRDAPVMVPDLSNVIDIAVGGEFACALDAAGEIVCWGNDRSNQLGEYGR